MQPYYKLYKKHVEKKTKQISKGSEEQQNTGRNRSRILGIEKGTR